MSKKLSRNIIITRAKKVHGSRYDYSLVSYFGYHTHMEIYCQQHGIFKSTPANHIHRKSGCPRCAINEKPQHKPTSKENFILKAIKTHGNLYDYSQVQYKNTHTSVVLLCPKHGPFNKLPVKHLQGSKCPKCSRSSKGENIIRMYLNEQEVSFVEQKVFTDCVNPKTGKHLKFDFFIPEINSLIEFDGSHHFRPERFNGISIQRANQMFKEIKYRDQIKNTYARDNDINLFRLSGGKRSCLRRLREILEF